MRHLSRGDRSCLRPPEDRVSRLLFYVLVLVTRFLAYQVLSPLLASLAWAAVFAMVLHRVHVEHVGWIGPNRSALVNASRASVSLSTGARVAGEEATIPSAQLIRAAAGLAKATAILADEIGVR